MSQSHQLKEVAFRSAIRSVEMYGLILMSMDGRIVTWNSGAIELLGYSELEVLDRHFEFIFTPEDRALEIPQREITKALTNGYAYDDRWHLRKDQTRLYVNGGVCLLKNDAGESLGFVKIIRDQTEKKRYLDQIEELNMKLQRAHAELQDYASALEQKVQERTQKLNERNAELQDFCYSIAHDLRAPLRSIQAMSQVVLEDYGASLDSTCKDYMSRITTAGAQLDRLTIDLLEYTRFAREEITLIPINLEKIVDEVLSNLAESINRCGAHINVHRPLPSAIGQRAYVMQILGNFLSNALKFAKPNEQSVIEIWGEVKAERVYIYLKDNGIGISPEYHAKIFLLFERLNPKGDIEGTGAGLTIARKAAQRMNGDVGVLSSENEGSTFWLELEAKK
jgi:PAS domain S-box-containing protein